MYTLVFVSNQQTYCTDSVHITEVSGKWQLEVVEDSACGFTAE